MSEKRSLKQTSISNLFGNVAKKTQHEEIEVESEVENYKKVRKSPKSRHFSKKILPAPAAQILEIIV